MDMQAEKMIAALSPEIDEKCAGIKEAKAEKLQSRIFMIMCILAVILPAVFVFFGISLSFIIVPIIFITAAFVILSPIIISQQGGRSYEQV